MITNRPNVQALLFSSAPAEYDQTYINNLLVQLNVALQRVVQTDQAAPSVLLLSPGGKVFRVSVSDTGVLSTAAVEQGNRNA